MRKILFCSLLSLSIASTLAFADTKLKLVEVITSPDRTAVLRQQVADFEANNPGITVEITSLPWGQAFEKLATMVQSGQTPDVVEMPDSWQGLYASNDMLVDLEARIAASGLEEKLTDKTLAMARNTGGKANMIPYGFYLRAMFWNKKIFAQAGMTEAPKTMAEFVEASKKIKALGTGVSGYCLRGGVGGTNGWMMFMAAMRGSPEFFDEQGNSLLSDPESIKGAQFLVDLYKNGHAPRDSVNWGFNEIVSGFYSGKCAMLDQDPDALISIAKSMNSEDFAVAPMPLGPSGKAYPTIGYTGWSIFKQSENKDSSWKLISHLTSPEENLTWAKKIGVLPIHKGAEKNAFFSTEQYSGWFEELNNPNYIPLTMPTHLKGWGYFGSVMAKDSSQEALLGMISTEKMVEDWAAYLTKEQQAWMKTQ